MELKLITASQAIKILTDHGHKVERNRKNAPGYQWAFDYKVDGSNVTLGTLRGKAIECLS